jgi:uncharacterized protein YdgA (DUF945 family)
MKKIITIALVFVLVVLGGYFSTGLITERTLKKNLSTLNQANDLSVELVGYRRGLFQSTADLTWHMQMPEKVIKKDDGRAVVVPAKVYTFDMPLVVYHGPVLFEKNHIRFGLGAAQGHLTLPEAYASEFSNIFTPQSTQPQLVINLFVTYLNKTHLEVEVPAFQLVMKRDQSQVEWLGMRSDLRFSPESTHLQGHFALDGLRLMSEKANIVLNKITSTYNVHKAENGLFLGEANLNLPVLKITDKKQTEFELQQLEFTSKSTLQNDSFGSSFHAAFKRLVSQDKTYGPGEFEVGIKNLNATVLAELNQDVNQLKQTGTTGADTQQLLFSLLPKLPKLLEKGTVFEVSTLKLALPEGAVDGSMRVAFPQSTSETNSPIQAFPKVEGEGHLKMPATFVKSLLVRSFQQELLRAHLDKNNNKTQEASADKQPLAPTLPNAKPQQTTDKTKDTTVAPVTLAELNQQAVHHADQKLADLIQLGVLKAKGADYVLDLKLSSGRLLVNGQPFHSGMLSF